LRRSEVVTRIGASVASGKVARLCRDHRFSRCHGSHVDRLIGAGVQKDFEEPLGERATVDPGRGGNDLKTQVGMHVTVFQRLCRHSQIREPAAGASTDLGELNRCTRHVADGLHVLNARRTSHLRLERAHIHFDHALIGNVGVVHDDLEIVPRYPSRKLEASLIGIDEARLGADVDGHEREQAPSALSAATRTFWR